MEKIHSSHSKKELQEIIEVFELNIANYKNMNKKDISYSLLYELSKIDNIIEDNEFFFIKDKAELMEYLINPDSSKSLTIKEKAEVMEIAKYIIMYCKNSYYLSCSPFLNWEDMNVKVKYIAQYGDIPSVRKAVESFNNDPRMIELGENIVVSMSSRCRKKMERKRRMVQKQKVSLKVLHGTFPFDLTKDIESMRLAKAPFNIN
jgi:hypothetical protein